MVPFKFPAGKRVNGMIWQDVSREFVEAQVLHLRGALRVKDNQTAAPTAPTT
jgi:hypothetical protein